MSTPYSTQYILHLADNALILAQRNAEWCGHGPVLEQDIAITNISLDLLGQARNFYQYAAELINKDSDNTTTPATEDSLAYLRTEREFKNCLLVEQPRGDWASTILRQFFFSQYQFLLFEELIKKDDAQLSGIAAKSLKEITYHVRWSSEWVIRLGDGTAESRKRIETALDELWTYTGELFIPAEYERQLNLDLETMKSRWLEKVAIVFDEATIEMPSNVFMQTGGKEGIHSEHLGYILTDLQYLQRTYPGASW